MLLSDELLYLILLYFISLTFRNLYMRVQFSLKLFYFFGMFLVYFLDFFVHLLLIHGYVLAQVFIIHLAVLYNFILALDLLVLFKIMFKIIEIFLSETLSSLSQIIATMVAKALMMASRLAIDLNALVLKLRTTDNNIPVFISIFREELFDNTSIVVFVAHLFP